MPSRPVDEKIAKLTLDSDSFKKNATDAIKCIGNLNKKFDSVNSVKMDNIEKSVDSIASRFTLLGNIVQNVFGRIANSIVSIGTNIFRALNITPLLQGYSEYELKLNSIQTIMVNTGESIDVVSAALNELNEYADKTIYSFSDMTRNIGLFTAAGVDLQTSISSIKGLANLAAGMGVSNADAARATWQLSQALGSGVVRLQDWISVENAGLGGQYFQKALVEHANKVGTLSMSYEELTKKYGTFRNSLTEGGWLTSDVLSSTLEQFANDQTLVDASTKVKSFSQLMETFTSTLGSGWAQTWEILFGNIEEAKEFWTPISDEIVDFVTKSSDARNKFVQEWKDLGGLDATVKGLGNIFKGLGNVMDGVKQAFSNLFPDITPKMLADAAKSFEEATRDFSNIKINLSGIGDVFNNLSNSVSNAKDSVSKLFASLKQFLTFENVFKGGALFGLFAYFKGKNALGKGIKELEKAISELPKKALSNLIEPLEKISALATGGRLLMAGTAIATVGFGIKQMAEGLSTISGIEIADIVKSMVSIFALIAGVSKIMKLLPGDENVLAAFGITALADAIERLAPAIDVMSKIDPARLATTVAALGIILTELVIAMKYASGNILKASSFIGLSLAIDLIVVAFKALENIEVGKALKVVGIIGLVLTELTIAVNKANHAVLGSMSMVGIAVALDILSAGLIALSMVPANNVLQTVVLIGMALTELVVAVNMLNHSMMGGATMIELSIALDILSAGLIALSFIPVDKALAAVGIIGLVLTELTIAVNKLGHSISGGLSMVLVTTALTELSVAMAIVASIPANSALQSVVYIGMVLSELVIAMKFLKGSLAGGATMLLLATSLTLLSGALSTLSSMSLDSIGVSLIALAGGLGVLIAAGYLAKGAAVGILTLATSMATFGIMATGIAMIIEAITEAIVKLNGVGINIDFKGLLGGFLDAVIQLIPQAATAVVQFLTALMQAFQENIPIIAEQLTLSILTMLQTVTTLMQEYGPQFVDAIINLFATLGGLLIQFVSEAFTRLYNWIMSTGVGQAIAGGVQWVVGLISGIVSWIGNIISTGIQAVQNFINGILSLPGEIFQAGVSIITGFIDGIKSWFGNLFGAGADSAKEAKSGMESVDATSAGSNFVQGFINGMGSLAGSLWDTAVGLAQSAWDALTSTLQERSPSRLTTKGGIYFTQGFINGISSLTNKAKMASKNVARNALSGLATLYDEAPNDYFDFQPTITPIWDLSGYQAIDDLMYKYDLPSMHAEIQNGSNSKLLKVLESIDKKLDSLSNKMEDVKLHVSVPPTELDGEAITDAVDEIHTIRDLLDKTGKGE